MKAISPSNTNEQTRRWRWKKIRPDQPSSREQVLAEMSPIERLHQEPRSLESASSEVQMHERLSGNPNSRLSIKVPSARGASRRWPQASSEPPSDHSDHCARSSIAFDIPAQASDTTKPNHLNKMRSNKRKNLSNPKRSLASFLTYLAMILIASNPLMSVSASGDEPNQNSERVWPHAELMGETDQSGAARLARQAPMFSAQTSAAVLSRQQTSQQQSNAPLADSFGSRLVTANADSDLHSSVFSNRQGQLEPLDPAQMQAMRARNSRPQASNGTPLLTRVQSQSQSQSQNQQGFRSSQVDQLNGGNRFQRLRSGASSDPSQPTGSSASLMPMAPLSSPSFPINPTPQFSPQASGSQMTGTRAAQQPQQQPQVPTLSAFDLSSLANLANQASSFAAGQTQNMNQQSQAFTRRLPAVAQPLNSQTSRLAASNGQSSATELPFIRQVFRPAEGTEGSADSSALGSARPTPPPLYVPQSMGARRFPNAGPAASSSQRPRSSSPLLLDAPSAGFSPIRPANVDSPVQQPPREQVFFEPSNLSRLPPQSSLSRSSGANRVNGSQHQQPSLAAQMDSTRRRAPSRRPSQRPSLPSMNSPQHQQANDVIRLASSAIQAANEGLALVGSPSTLPSEPATSSSRPTESSPSTTLTSLALSESPIGTTTTATPPSTTTTAGMSTDGSTGRRNAPPMRSSANIFALTSIATSAPSSFSPALPINAAVAANGGRRRIPVRPQSQQQQRASVTTTSPSTVTTTMVAPSSTGSSSQSGSRFSGSPSSVRRPELEEFYETISTGGNPTTSTTQIDAFGSAQQQQQQQPNSSVSPIRSTSSNGQAQMVTNGGQDGQDLFGSRLPSVASSSSPSRDQTDGEQQLRARLTPMEPGSNEKPPSGGQQPAGTSNQPAVLVPVTYMTTLTYLTTVLHGTHTLETSHESTIKSTELATLNAHLMDQIEHRRALIEPTATISVSSKTKGKGTTIVNLKSAVSAYNQELVEALGVQSSAVPSATQVAPSAAAPQAKTSNVRHRASRTLELAEVEEARKSLVTELLYLYTMRPVGAQQDAGIEATSVRSELIPGKTLDSGELLRYLAAEQASGTQLIDSNGFMRLESRRPDDMRSAINLGSTMDKEGATITEINMNVASLVRFDDISNALLDVRPTRLADFSAQATSNQIQSQSQSANRRKQLEGSFDLQLALTNALDRLSSSQNSPSSGSSAFIQPTPSLDSSSIQVLKGSQSNKPATASDDLLRSSTVSPTDSPRSQDVNANRSQLRSRVASSRFRSAQIGGQQLTRQPSLIVTSSVLVPASEVSAEVTAPISRSQKPFRSRIVRPTLRQAENQTAPVLLESSQQFQNLRPSKQRLVVVTRTGQFGVRATAIGNQDAALGVQPSEVSPGPNVVVSSRVLRPNRFRTTTRAPATPQIQLQTSEASTSQPLPAKPSSEEPESSPTNGAPTTQSVPTPPLSAGVDSKEPNEAETTTSRITTANSTPSEDSKLDSRKQDFAPVDGSGSVIVTYFTTTTHTIPFTINSETIFTTIEETNSRIATEMMSDLAATPFLQSPNLLEPTQVLSTILPTAAPPVQIPTVSNSPPTETPRGSTNAEEVSKVDGKLEPSFVVAQNTRTYFTTFTYFTTYSTGTSMPTIKSSESTTSNIVTETVTSMLQIEPTTSITQPSILMSEAPSMPTTTAPASTTASESSSSDSPPTRGSSSTQTGSSEQSEATTGAPDSPTSTATMSELPPTLSGVESSRPGTRQDSLNQELVSTGQSQDSGTTPSIQSSPAISDDQTDKITRTKSMYTTLTHYITFFSGTKTQLSTIQEISPTVMTEYVDRTDYERQLQLESAKDKESKVLLVPSQLADQGIQIQVTSTPVLPTTTQSIVPLEFGSSSTPTTQPTSDSSGSQSATTDGYLWTSSETSQQQPEAKQAPSNSIIELSDLIAANSSQSGRVSLSGNLGAAIKDIVQLLAGNRTTNPISPLTNLPSPTTPLQSVASETSEEPASTTTNLPSSTMGSSQAQSKRPSNGSKWFGRSREQHLQQLQGSMSSPAVASSSATDRIASSSSANPTPELQSTSRTNGDQMETQAVSTIFYGDDSNEERKELAKTVWPGSQSSVLVTSVEPSTRMLTLTTTKVYYTRDSPFTVTSSFTSAIPPRTFVSTIMGSRTLVNQLGGPTQTLSSAQALPSASSPTSSGRQQTQVGNRQETLAENTRLAVQEKQRKQQQQQQQLETQKKKQSVPQAKQPQPQQPQSKLTKSGANQTQSVTNANINQCQPACKDKSREVCKFTPASETSGAQGTFACACRPGYHMMTNLVSGKRQCHEIQSYVILLRLLQIGDQQVSFKRELQDRSSSDFKQISRVIKDHIRRAYMTSDMTRDRFVSADVLNYARPSSGSSPVIPTGLSVASDGRQPVSSINMSQQDPPGSGLLVNITVQLQPPAANQNDVINEGTLKEELTKKLNMRQAAALAAATAASSVDVKKSNSSDPSSDVSTSNIAANDSLASGDEMLPNPNALFLADVEQVSDLDECASPSLNDCHEAAICINEIGSYRCDCGEYPDANPQNPGRSCGMELKACDYCNNRGDCLRVPSLLAASINSSSTVNYQQRFSTVCQCNPFYLGRRCDINGWVLATVVPTTSILLIVSICLVIYLCRRWRKRSALSKGFRNIGSFGPNLISSTLDRKAMLESSSESSDTHQRHAHHHHSHLRGASNAIYDVHGAMPSDPSSSSNESSPRQMVRNQALESGVNPGQQQQIGNYCNSIPPQIVIPRARHNQVNYAVHRGQVYMW